MIDGGYTAYGGIGDDEIVAVDSSAIIYGNAGHDILFGIGGSYTVYGGNGTVDPTDGKDTITLSRSAALVYGNGGSDLINAHSEQTGSEGSDTITAFYGNALTAYGGAGDDTIDLAYGSGIMLGQTGSDSLVVSLASATMDGGAGDDILSATHSSITKMTGGTGSDTFVLNSFDSATNVSKDIGYTEITDFTTADELDLQDHNGVITSVPAWNTHASFFTTGSNLVVQFHNTTAAHTTPFLVFDGLAGHGFHSFTDMQAAGYHIVATFDVPST